jgi:hypothetical protein
VQSALTSDPALAADLQPYLDQPHLFGVEVLGYDLLTEIHSEWILAAWLAERDATMQAHRNSYKTTAVLTVGVIWWLLWNPNDRVLFVRKTWEDAAGIVGEVRQHYDGNQDLKHFYQFFFGVKKIRGKPWGDGGIQLSTRRRIRKEPSLMPLGIGGSVTGLHFEKVLCDDIVTLRDRVSRAERETTKLFVRELKNIVLPGHPRYIQGTPWHPEDSWSILPTGPRYPVRSVPIEGLTEEVIADIRRELGPSLYAANMDLQHVAADSALFRDPQYAEWPARASPIAFLDPAYSGTHYTALALIARYNDRVHLIVWAWRLHVIDAFQRIIRCLRDYNAGTVWIEENADKGAAVRDLRPHWPNVSGYSESENKHRKIIRHLSGNWRDLHWAEPVYGELDYQARLDAMRIILDYQEGQEPDDSADVAANSCRHVIKKTSTLEKRFGFKG